MIAAAPAQWRRRRLIRIALQPIGDDVMIELLRPQHPGERLPHYVAAVGRKVLWYHLLIEFVSFMNPIVKDSINGVPIDSGCLPIGQDYPNSPAVAGADFEDVVSGRFGPRLRRIHGIATSIHDVVIDAVLGVRRSVIETVQAADVR